MATRSDGSGVQARRGTAWSAERRDERRPAPADRQHREEGENCRPCHHGHQRSSPNRDECVCGVAKKSELMQHVKLNM